MNLKRLPFLLLPVLLAACGNYVVQGGSDEKSANLGTGGQGGTGGAGGSTSSGDNTPDPTQPAVALTRAQLDVLWEEYWANHPLPGSSSSGGGPALNPDDLFLRISDLGASCDSPTTELTCGGHWQLSIALPPALQQVGVYDLESPELLAYSHMSETDDLNSPSPEDCPWGGGSIGSGTLEILSIDDTEVHFRVELTNPIWSTNPNGEYVAPRCPVYP
ncbi:hypothetical protein [Polyangium mundeleinium]|uniref:Lipoprotein n=1 Tax=Polyangium mundeleinium TaxID=2995306 RepID=A0ABT5ERD1_9BACT|nr:hypothetical protein [Polyangium mundeleinium]MDC0743276.1 hypothetical protein [Polyangium mundeleinium]